MALGSLISLRFCLKWLARAIWRIAENLNYTSHIRGPDGQAFPLPSQNRPDCPRNPPAIPLRAQPKQLGETSHSALNGANRSPQDSAMKTMSAGEAKNAFGPMIGTASAEPVLIEKHKHGVWWSYPRKF